MEQRLSINNIKNILAAFDFDYEVKKENGGYSIRDKREYHGSYFYFLKDHNDKEKPTDFFEEMDYWINY